MNDPFAWSFPFGRLFGINIRIHVLFPFVFAAQIMQVAFDKDAVTNGWIDVSLVLTALFVSVLLHEFGHCLGAWWVGGESRQVMLWPLGGLAGTEVPHTPRANFIMVAAGPLTNIVLALAAAGGLLLAGGVKPNFLFGYLGRGADQLVSMDLWGDGTPGLFSPYSAAVLLQHFFWVNYILTLFNLVLVGFPMDMGRIFQCILWKFIGYRRATLGAIYAGFVTMFALLIYAVVAKDFLMAALAVMIYASCKSEWLRLESTADESLFGYDFSQGYTSLERDETAPRPPPKPKLSWWQRWKKKRAERRAHQEEERRLADESRLDQLLDKVQREGKASLTSEELRFMQRVSDRYRNQRKG